MGRQLQGDKALCGSVVGRLLDPFDKDEYGVSALQHCKVGNPATVAKDDPAKKDPAHGHLPQQLAGGLARRRILPLCLLFCSGSRRQIRQHFHPGTLNIPLGILPDGRQAPRRVRYSVFKKTLTWQESGFLGTRENITSLRHIPASSEWLEMPVKILLTTFAGSC
jgi:hypothetical protein